MSDRGKTRLYYAAAVCLLVVVAALRFYNLPGNTMTFDEATAANNSRGSLQEVIDNTRNRNTSPVLYPLVLFAVQEVESSALSVRIVPAAASVLTVAVILFLLPRFGVSRWAAFIAALLAAVSVNAIWNAQDVREYSVDALVAVLMTAGLLSYLRGKRRHRGIYVLFCASLFIGPLVQYGLVLFGAAVLGTLAFMEGKTFWFRRASLRDGLRFRQGRVWNKIRYLTWPLGGVFVIFCLSLFVAPPVQYGLVLFGAAVFGAIAVMERKTLWSRRGAQQDGLRFREGWVWNRLGYLTWPIVSFAAGSVASYAATVRYHWSGSRSGVESYLSWAYYSGEYTDLPAVIRFVLSRTEAVFHYHTTEFLTIAGLAGLGIFLILSFRKARLDAITALFLTSFVIAAGAALLRLYPYGETRQCMYLGPIIFLGYGLAPFRSRRCVFLHSQCMDGPRRDVCGGWLHRIQRRKRYQRYDSIRGV